MKSARQRGSIRMLLGMVFAMTLLGLTEIVLRLNGVQPAYRHDALGQWRVTPNIANQTFTGADDNHRFVVSTNGDGFRTQVDRTTVDEQIRIALIGDSTVFGWGVEAEDSLAAVTEARLIEQGWTNVQVINFGQPGYSTAMMGVLFRDAIAAYRPDLSIVFIPMHDYNLSLVSDLEFLEGASSVRGFIRSLLVQHVALYEWMRRRLYPFANEVQVLPHQQSQEPRVERVSQPEQKRILNQIRVTAEQWGGEVSVGFLPFYSDLQSGSGAAQSHSGAASIHLLNRPGVQALEEWSREHNRPVFDLRDCCAYGAAERTFPFDHTHLNALGNREVGQALATAISVAVDSSPQTP